MKIKYPSKIRIIWLILLGLIVAFLAWQLVSPTGSWTCRQEFSSNSSWPLTQFADGRSCLGAASPGERVAQGTGGPLLMLADPVYFSVFSPRPFSRAELNITYRPSLSSSTPIFEAGFLADKKLWRYQLKPVYNLWLERGFSGWSSVSDGQYQLIQKESTYKSVSDFLSSWKNGELKACTGNDCLATYNVNLADYPSALDLSALNQAQTNSVIKYSLRGAHQFYFYLAGSSLDLSGAITDRNDNKDKDEAEFLLFTNGRQVASVKIPDNRLEKEESGDVSSSQSFQIARSDLSPGIYRLEFRASDDLLLSNLSVNSPYLSAINKIWIEGNNPLKLLTDAAYLQIKALDPAVLQTVNFGQTEIDITEIYHQYEIKNKQSGPYDINLISGGLILENNGVFALSASSLINPDYPRLDRFAPLTGKIDYILAEYQPTKTLADAWYKSSLDFAIADFYRENNQYSLILSAPGLKLDSGAGGLVEIKEIEIRFYGKSLVEKIKDWLSL